MEVKEAIEFIKDEIMFADDNYDEDKIKQRDEIISLLQELKKYKKIVDDIENYEVKENFTVPDEYLGIQGGVMKYVIKTIKQKYFPQTVKKVITIEVEAREN